MAFVRDHSGHVDRGSHHCHQVPQPWLDREVYTPTGDNGKGVQIVEMGLRDCGSGGDCGIVVVIVGG